MRIAWFSPLPPNRSGIAAYSAELLPRLAAHEIEAFIDDSGGQDAPARIAPVEGATIRGAHDFPWRHARQPYDAVVYHVGNDASHDYLWPYMVRYPGLVVLHDGQLHQARAQALIRQHREADFRAEFTYCHPEASPAPGGPGGGRPWQHALLLLADDFGSRAGGAAGGGSQPVAGARAGRRLPRVRDRAHPSRRSGHHGQVTNVPGRRAAPPRNSRRRGRLRVVRPGHAREEPGGRCTGPRSGRAGLAVDPCADGRRDARRTST